MSKLLSKGPKILKASGGTGPLPKNLAYTNKDNNFSTEQSFGYNKLKEIMDGVEGTDGANMNNVIQASSEIDEKLRLKVDNTRYDAKMSELDVQISSKASNENLGIVAKGLDDKINSNDANINKELEIIDKDINDLQATTTTNTKAIAENTKNITKSINDIITLDNRVNGLESIISVTDKGVYNPSTSYNTGDLVSFEKNVYVSRKDNNTSPLTNETDWLWLDNIDLTNYLTEEQIKMLLNEYAKTNDIIEMLKPLELRLNQSETAIKNNANNILTKQNILTNAANAGDNIAIDINGKISASGGIGPQGPKGDQGIQGVQGSQGPTGIKGDKGDKGDTGPQGPSGSGNTPWVQIPLRFNFSSIAGPFSSYDEYKYEGWFKCSLGNVFPTIPTHVGDISAIFFAVSIQGADYNSFGLINFTSEEMIIRSGAGSAPTGNNYSNDGEFKLYGRNPITKGDK